MRLSDLKFIICAGLTLLVLVCIVSSMDYNDQLASQELYCEMVRSGAWPDFKGLYDEICL